MLERVLTGLLTVALLPAAEISFNQDIRPILSAKCIVCHGPDDGVDAKGKANRKAGLRLDTPEGAYAEKDGIAAIVPNSLEYAGRKFSPPEGFDRATFFRDSIGVTVLMGAVEDLVFHIHPVLKSYLETTPIHASQRIFEHPDGIIELRLRTHQTFELTQLILGYGPEIQVIQPESLRQKIASQIRETLRFYEKS